MRHALVALGGLLVLTGASLAGASEIRGDYIEARTADVYTGPCFSNSEVFITGDQAVVAWKVARGSWAGVDLSGLGVAAAIAGNTTFSMDRPELARSVILVDQKADPEQRAALVAMAKDLIGPRLSKVVAVRPALMDLTIESHQMAASEESAAHANHRMPHAPRAALWVAGLAEILTRPLAVEDIHCGNEVVAYEPLSKGVEVQPAYTLGHSFKGRELGSRWDDPNCRSSFVGTFSVSEGSLAAR